MRVCAHVCQKSVLCRENLFILCRSIYLTVKKPMTNELRQEIGGGSYGREGEGDGENKSGEQSGAGDLLKNSEETE